MKYKCDNCENKFEWIADGHWFDIQKIGQQYIDKEFWDESGNGRWSDIQKTGQQYIDKEFWDESGIGEDRAREAM